ncbi:MAG: sulfite exporter TauE/SafE family protein [Chloroflexi bacterium]|nr:sulfite exporter TauE/SafE family protein [Chloroflexota bacterium]
MLDAVSPTELVFAVLVVFFACTVFSAMGFGIGIVGLPLLFLLFDPATSIILLNVMALPVVILVVLRNREHLRPREIVPIVVAGIVGALIGGWVLAMLDIAEYKDIFGIAVLVVIIALTVGGMFRMPFRMPRASILGPVCGFLVGLFITGIGVGGPLLVLFFISQGWGRQGTRASMALYFIFMGTALIVGYGLNDLYTPARTTLLLASIVPAMLAALLGDRIAKSLTDAVWRRGVIALVLVSSTFGLALKMWNLVAA